MALWPIFCVARSSRFVLFAHQHYSQFSHHLSIFLTGPLRRRSPLNALRVSDSRSAP
jgi:hypothetical protein